MMRRARSFVALLSRPGVVLPLLSLAMLGWGLVARVRLRERPVRLHLERGMEYARQGQGREAEREWTAALSLDARCAPAYELLSGYYLSSQQWSRAAEALQKLHALAPAEPHVSCRLASALLNARDEMGAYREAETELRQSPDCVPALAIAAVMLSQVGEEQQRLAYLRRAAQLRPDDADLQFLLADALTDTYAYKEARTVLERVLQLEPGHAGALTLLGVGWLNERSVADHLARAESYLTRSLALQPLDGRARLTLGRVYLERNQPAAAIVQLEEAARLQPYSYRVPFELARAYDAARRPAPAAAARRRFAVLRGLASEERMLEKRCSTNPTSFDDYYRMGLLQMRKKDYRKADYYLRRARALHPDHPRLLAALRALGDRPPPLRYPAAASEGVSRSGPPASAPVPVP